MQKGNIGVTTENIFPIIKKFLYSDREIFLREIISNAIDATQKLKTYASKGEFGGELGDLTVRVKLDKETITVSDRGIGLTAEEIDKYINQIAFSGANEFLEKYKEDANAIIGHFGLGFYSSFMVSKKVEIVTKSYKDGAKAVKWSCDGSPEFTIEETEKDDRGTDIIMYIDEESKEYLEEKALSDLLKKYCHFLPVPIAFGKKKTYKDGVRVETDEDEIINITEPLWTKKPSDITEEEYKKFYRELYPFADEPLFWIHLNVDYPFNLTGILYFPSIKNALDLQKNKIQLYCNQVFVTDIVDGIVPEFLTLLHGVIDSPDIPLNVSRSYLQSDSNVKKISTYITKKVTDRLQSIFKNDRKQFEEKWDKLKVFINYGMLSQDDMYDKASKFALMKDTEGNYYTYEEYRKLIEANQTDKDGNVVYLYTYSTEEQYSYIEAAKNKGYNVLLMDVQLDVALIGMLERKMEKSHFLRVDSDIIDRLIVKDEPESAKLNFDQTQMLSTMFKSQMPDNDKMYFMVDTHAMGEEAAPLYITQSEYMRRMKEMAKIQSGMSFYNDMADNYSLVLNADHKLIKGILADAEAACSEQVAPIMAQIKDVTEQQETLRKAHEGKKSDEIPQVEKDQKTELGKQLTDLQKQRDDIYTKCAANNKVLHQLIDLALLRNHMLKGEALDQFIRRSVDLIK